jgi:DNA polymerase III delta prime subunit
VRVGNQAPRLRSVPAYSATLGQEAIDLTAAAGQILDPWQCDVVCDILAIQDDGRWAAFETCTIAQRQQGKGGIIEALELGGLFLFGERLILHSAHEYKTAQEAFLRIKSLIDGCADLSRYVKAIREANGEQQIILMSGARLRFVARSKGSGRGFSGQRNILDEAYALTRTQLAALLPTMSAQPNPQLNQFSTVPDPATMPDPDEAVLPAVHARALEAVRSGDAGTLAYHDWSMRPNENPADVDLWYETNPALGIRIAEDYVRAEFAALGPAKFSTERLGLWPDPRGSQWQVIPFADWDAAKDPASDRPSPVAFAVTLSTDRRWATIAAAGPRPDGLLLVHVVDRREGTGWVIERLQELIARWKPVAVVIDKGSPASSLATEAEEAGIALTPIQTRDVAAAAGALYDGIAGRPARDPETGEMGRDPRVVRHRDQPELTAAVAGAVKRPLTSQWAWDQLAAAVDITPVIACSNALWGYMTRPPDQAFFATRR